MIHVLRYALIALYAVLCGSAALVDTLPIPWRFVAKRELVWIPFFGWALAATR